MRFNYLRDGAPDAFEQLRPRRLPEALRTPLAALTTAVIVVAAWWAIEQVLLSQARSELQRQALRLQISRVELAELKLRRSHLEQLVSVDARLREIRRSGAALACGLADIANHVPATAWLTSIARVDGGLEIDGRAEGLDALGETVADLMHSSRAVAPDLIRASKEDRDRSGTIVNFAVRVGERR
ncbi:MAG TPA: PilN domain-containing protein [Candidatus Acidoferrales bacterium]|nr:PilN domain-containing protein [Candidatus Acidoferrales bacterium]